MARPASLLFVERPYDDPTNDEQVWSPIQPQPVRVDALVPTQPVLMMDRLLACFMGEKPEGWDPHPHVVEVDGVLYIHDGHHRWVRALLAGVERIEARTLRWRLAQR